MNGAENRRREILRRLLAGVGAGVALPGGAATAMFEPLGEAEAAMFQARAQAPGWKPEFLDAHQAATLTQLCARILPGSEKALSDRFIDMLLAIDTAERKKRFVSSLGALDAASQARFQKAFKALSEAQQVELLTAWSTAASARPELPPRQTQRAVEGPPPGDGLRDHFDNVKGWIVRAYYSSEAGLKELGYTGETMFESFPDCTHSDHP